MRFLSGVLAAVVFMGAAQAEDGTVRRSRSETDTTTPTTAVVSYHRECSGVGMPPDLPEITAISGVGTIITTTWTCAAANGCPATKTWVRTSTRTGTTPDYTFTGTCIVPQ